MQAINYRIILTIDPANRISAQRPDDYDTALIRELEFGSEIDGIPNRKLGLNRPQLLGPANSYVERDWAARRRVMDDHWEAALEMLWFRQSDPAVSEEERRRWCEYGLARDEFADHGHRPYEIYFREGRRLRGRSRLTQADTTPLPGMSRPPLHTDSIAFTEWYVDSHACTPRRVNGSLEEGKIMLHQETFSGQIPFDALLPEGVDNLTVPVCLSATHVAWNTVRLESTWMHLAESAAHATVHAVRCHQNIAAIDRDGLLRTLAACGVALAISNDLESTLGDETVAAAQYFSTRGFLPDYDARLAMPLDRGIDREWAWGWQADGIEAGPIAFARWVGLAAAYAEGAISRVEFAAMLPPAELDGRGETNFTRGEALTILWRLVKSRPSSAGASLPEEPLTSLPSSVSYI